MTPSQLITKSRKLGNQKELIKSGTKYKYVRSFTHKGVTAYVACVSRLNNWSKMFTSLHDAAIAVDLQFISHGLEPINILKRK